MGKIENATSNAIIELVRLRGGFAWRNNTGAVKTEKRFIRYGCVGSPDVLGAYKGVPIGVEVKRPLGPRGGKSGREQSPEQIEFQRGFEAAGGWYLVARSVGEVDDWLDWMENDGPCAAQRTWPCVGL